MRVPITRSTTAAAAFSGSRARVGHLSRPVLVASQVERLLGDGDRLEGAGVEARGEHRPGTLLPSWAASGAGGCVIFMHPLPERSKMASTSVAGPSNSTPQPAGRQAQLVPVRVLVSSSDGRRSLVNRLP